MKHTGLHNAIRVAIKQHLQHLNERDTERAVTVVANSVLRRAQLRRIKRQPGLTEEQREIERQRIQPRKKR